MRTFKEFLAEGLDIKNITFKSEVNGYKFEVNDRIDHEILPRIIDRTELPLKILRDKIYKGVNLVIKKAEAGKFRFEKNHVGLKFKKAGITLSLMIVPSQKYIRMNTILDPDMEYTHGIKWKLNEFNEKVFRVPSNNKEEILMNENRLCSFFDSFRTEEDEHIEGWFMIEPGIDGITEVFLEDQDLYKEKIDE